MMMMRRKSYPVPSFMLEFKLSWILDGMRPLLYFSWKEKKEAA
jgi:hypothetical protein